MNMTNFEIFVASIKLKFLDIFLADKNILCSIFFRRQSFGMKIQNCRYPFDVANNGAGHNGYNGRARIGGGTRVVLVAVVGLWCCCSQSLCLS